ncbi:MAG: ATP-binding protein [Bacteroidales bacterium]|nr:ATP-binding protein [Bacteroidales bacterium]
MKRYIYDDLKAWKDAANRKPLILLGARQVGKTYVLKQFGEEEFANMVYVNCHNNPFAESLFVDFDIERILYQISVHYEQRIVPGETLLFFDEIQEVKNGIPALKYFCEDMRSLHVVVAGSLLGITLREDESYPVGKVDNLRMYPMTFDEFLVANGRERLAESLRALDERTLSAHHATLVELLRQYYFVGGMPEAVTTWLSTHDPAETRKVQRAILSTYNGDFGKHTKTEAERIRMVWKSLPAQLAKENKKFVFGVVKKSARAAEFEKAIQWLVDAGLVYRVCRISKPEEPLQFYADSMCYKVFMMDVGLLACMCGARSASMLLGDSVFSEFKGAFTENFVMTQIKSLERYDSMDDNIYYYSKDSSPLEVDFVIQSRDRVIPVEVKAEQNVRSKSLASFVNQEFAGYGLKGLRCSMLPFVEQDWMKNIPLYATEAYFSQVGLGAGD